MKKIYMFLCLVFLQTSVIAEEENTYSKSISAFLDYRLDNKSKKANPLLERKTIVISNEVETILEGLLFILNGTSYDLNISVTLEKETKYIMDKPYPSSQRVLKDVTTLEALKYVIGEYHDILIDPVYRHIGFELSGLRKKKSQTQIFYKNYRFSNSDKVSLNEMNTVLDTSMVKHTTLDNTNLASSDEDWFFNSKAKFTIQYTSVENKETALKIANRLDPNLGTPRIFKVIQSNVIYFVILAGEYNSYHKAMKVGKENNGWVRNFDTIRKNRCRSISKISNDNLVFKNKFCDK